MIKPLRNILLLCCLLGISACSEVELGSHLAKQIPISREDLNAKQEKHIGYFKVGNPYSIKGRTYYPKEKYQYSETGMASWYGPGFHGKMTANGEIFNQYELTAAHRTLQMPSMVRVTNLENGKSIIVRVNDRGPFAHNRVIDLSQRAAEVIGMRKKGVARVRVDVLEKESRQVAQASRAGKSTRGTEIVLNRGRSLDSKMPLRIATPISKPITAQSQSQSQQLAARVPVQSTRTRLQQAPIMSAPSSSSFDHLLRSQANAAAPARKPVQQQYFVDAGRFSSEDNALTARISIESLGQPVHVVSSTTGHQVKVGPFASQAAANDFARQLSQRGRVATVVMRNR